MKKFTLLNENQGFTCYYDQSIIKEDNQNRKKGILIQENLNCESKLNHDALKMEKICSRHLCILKLTKNKFAYG